MTWITDGSGTRWVPVPPRKRRRSPRALRFANLREGEVLIHRHKWRVERHDPARLMLANDNSRTETGTSISFAIAERLWFDPVAGEDDPVAGQMVGVRALTSHGPARSMRSHTLRGLASNGYHPATPEQSAEVLRWMADRDRLLERFDAGEITAVEARAAHRPWRVLLRDIGLDVEDDSPFRP